MLEPLAPFVVGGEDELGGPIGGAEPDAAPSVETPDVEVPVAEAASWDEAGGPEATEAEVLDWLAARYPRSEDPNDQWWASKRERVLAELADPTMVPEHTALELPTRRGLEAALAAWAGQDPNEFKLANAHRSWGELAAEAAQDMTVEGRRDKLDLTKLACEAETAYRRALAATGAAPASFAPDAKPETDWRDLDGLRSKLGPGARSGNIADYSRSELRKLLGFLERDCAHLSDDDLRGMALDGHLVPHYQGAPSHAELAAQYARYNTWSAKSRQSAFRKALRMSYGELAKSHRTDYSDVAERSADELRADLASRHPFLLRAGTREYNTLRGHYSSTAARALAERNNIATTRDERERNRAAEGAQDKLLTPLELSYKPAFDGFCEQFGGAHKLGQVRSGLGNRRDGARAPRNCLAYYSPGTGDIHINAAYAKQLKSKDLSPSQIEQVVSTASHELGHALEGRDTGSRHTGTSNEGTPEHTLDEGVTESIFGRLHCQDLAERMGLWSPERGRLREHATGGSYPKEVETVNALAAALCGELDKAKLREGGYAEPEALSPRAQGLLRELHLEHGPQGRIEQLTKRLQLRTGADDGDYTRGEGAVRNILRECKSKRYQYRSKRVPVLDASGQPMRGQWGEQLVRREYIEPANLGENLAAQFEELGL